MIVKIVDYDNAWPETFRKESNLIKTIIGDNYVEIHHIGSTAVPGLAAKPIIDMILVVHSLKVLDEIDLEMTNAGYVPKGEYGISGRRYYQKGGNRRTHQIHAFQQNDDNIIRHLVFRDYLINNNDVCREYATLKKKIADECKNDIEKYCDGKEAFVKHHESIAMTHYKIKIAQQGDAPEHFAPDNF